jgi:hypothetical protein
MIFFEVGFALLLVICLLLVGGIRGWTSAVVIWLQDRGISGPRRLQVRWWMHQRMTTQRDKRFQRNMWILFGRGPSFRR